MVGYVVAYVLLHSDSVGRCWACGWLYGACGHVVVVEVVKTYNCSYSWSCGVCVRVVIREAETRQIGRVVVA